MTWATKDRVGKRIVQFNPVTRDVHVRHLEAEPLLNRDAHKIPQDDDPVIIHDEDDDDERIIGGGHAQNPNPGCSKYSEPRNTHSNYGANGDRDTECDTTHNSC